MPLIVNNITKSFGQLEVLHGFSHTFEDGSVTAVTGPSGCGKTTLLSIMSGLLPPDSGNVYGAENKRKAIVFQDNRLIPSLNVMDNVGFVLDGKMPASQRDDLCLKALQVVEMDSCSHLFPDELSGGMARRVAIARALAYSSDIFFMDEPFTGIDDKLKEIIIRRIVSINSDGGRTTVLVTHDLAEARLMNCRVIRLP